MERGSWRTGSEVQFGWESTGGRSPTAGRNGSGRMSDGEQVPAKKMWGGREGVART